MININKKDYTTYCGNTKTILEKMANNPNEKKKYRLIITSPPYYQHRNYGSKKEELGRETTSQKFIDNLVEVFSYCKNLLKDDGSLFIVIGDTRRNKKKLMIPHRLAIALTEIGYTFQEDIIWYKKNAVSSSSKSSLTQSYEFVLFLSKNNSPYTNMDPIRTQGNEVISGQNKVPNKHMFQYKQMDKNTRAINKITKIIHNATPKTPFGDLPSTSEISWAYGYDPEKHCPTCHRKFKRHATRKRIGNHKHYPIFAACNPKGKNPGNVWDISTKAHHGNEHFAMFPEDLISRIVKFATKPNDYVLDPFVGRGTSGIVSACLQRKFTGIDLYATNVKNTKKNINITLDSKLPQKVLDQILS
jgi:DNA modification methylase